MVASGLKMMLSLEGVNHTESKNNFRCKLQQSVQITGPNYNNHQSLFLVQHVPHAAFLPYVAEPHSLKTSAEHQWTLITTGGI